MNGECEKLSNSKTEEKATSKDLKPEQMTSADYYFDSYAHFGKIICK